MSYAGEVSYSSLFPVHVHSFITARVVAKRKRQVYFFASVASTHPETQKRAICQELSAKSHLNSGLSWCIVFTFSLYFLLLADTSSLTQLSLATDGPKGASFIPSASTLLVYRRTHESKVQLSLSLSLSLSRLFSSFANECIAFEKTPCSCLDTLANRRHMQELPVTKCPTMAHFVCFACQPRAPFIQFAFFLTRSRSGPNMRSSFFAPNETLHLHFG